MSPVLFQYLPVALLAWVRLSEEDLRACISAPQRIAVGKKPDLPGGRASLSANIPSIRRGGCDAGNFSTSLADACSCDCRYQTGPTQKGARLRAGLRLLNRGERCFSALRGRRFHKWDAAAHESKLGRGVSPQDNPKLHRKKRL
jgi:hypothetical protein